VGEVVTGLLAEPALAQGMTVGRLAMRWPEVVGERLARESAPGGLEGGLLTVWASTGPWGAQLRFLSEEVRKRANETLGEEVVRGVRVVVRTGRGDGPRSL
jgi:predicted nucleic acid-binding Zn ribbon protein